MAFPSFCIKKILVQTESMFSWGCQCHHLLRCRISMLSLFLLWDWFNSHAQWAGPPEFCAHGVSQGQHANGAAKSGRDTNSQVSPLLLCVLYWSIRVYLQYKDLKIKVLRISRWQQQSIKPSMVPFWAQGPVWLHTTCEAGLVVLCSRHHPLCFPYCNEFNPLGVVHNSHLVYVTVSHWINSHKHPGLWECRESSCKSNSLRKCWVLIYWELIWHSVTELSKAIVRLGR